MNRHEIIRMAIVIGLMAMVGFSGPVRTPAPAQVKEQITMRANIIRKIAEDEDLQMLLSNEHSAQEIADMVGGTSAEKRYRRAMIKSMRFIVREYVKDLRED